MAHKSLMLDQEKFKRPDDEDGPIDLQPTDEERSANGGDEDTTPDTDEESDYTAKNDTFGGGEAKPVDPKMTPASLKMVAPSGSDNKSPDDNKSQPPQPASPASDKPNPYDKLFVTPEELQANRKKQVLLSALGNIGDNMASSQSWGNFYLGHPNPQSHASSDLAKQINGINQGALTDKATLLAQAQKKPELDMAQQGLDPNSSVSKAARQAYLSQLEAVKGTVFKNNLEGAKNIDALAKNMNGMNNYQMASAMGPFTKIFGNEAASGLKAQNSYDQRENLQQERMDNGIHQKTLAALRSDAPLKQKLNQYQNLDNAMNNFANAEHPTPQQFDELQQAVRSNLGIKGNSSVGEREHTLINGLGLNWDRWKQFLTMKPSDIGKDNELLMHVQDLAKLEQGNIKSQYADRIDAITEGNGSMYERRPNYKKDLERAVAANKKQIESSSNPEQAPQGEGLPLSQGALAGQTQQKRSVSPEEIQAYAQKYGMTPEAAAKWLESQGHGIGR